MAEDFVKKFEGLRGRYNEIEKAFSGFMAKKETLEATLSSNLKILKEKFNINSLEEAQAILNTKLTEINDKFNLYEGKVSEYEKVLQDFKAKGVN